MIVKLQILSDDGTLLEEHKLDLLVPKTVRRTSPLTVPCYVNDKVAGQYQFFGFSWQPHTKLSGKIGGY